MEHRAEVGSADSGHNHRHFLGVEVDFSLQLSGDGGEDPWLDGDDHEVGISDGFAVVGEGFYPQVGEGMEFGGGGV